MAGTYNYGLLAAWEAHGNLHGYKKAKFEAPGGENDGVRY